jgi:hypothetical protein
MFKLITLGKSSEINKWVTANRKLQRPLSWNTILKNASGRWEASVRFSHPRTHQSRAAAVIIILNLCAITQRGQPPFFFFSFQFHLERAGSLVIFFAYIDIEVRESGKFQ